MKQKTKAQFGAVKYSERINNAINEHKANVQSKEALLKEVERNKTQIAFLGKQLERVCENCVYFSACGDSTRTEKCDGRKTKTERKENKNEI